MHIFLVYLEHEYLAEIVISINIYIFFYYF